MMYCHTPSQMAIFGDHKLRGKNDGEWIILHYFSLMMSLHVTDRTFTNIVSKSVVCVRKFLCNGKTTLVCKNNTCKTSGSSMLNPMTTYGIHVSREKKSNIVSFL